MESTNWLLLGGLTLLLFSVCGAILLVSDVMYGLPRIIGGLYPMPAGLYPVPDPSNPSRFRSQPLRDRFSTGEIP